MFGYIKPYKMELKLKEIYAYQNIYCALCYTLRKEFGQMSGLLLSYDVTFLALLLNGMTGVAYDYNLTFRCPINPLKKIEAIVSKDAIVYSAFINYYMTMLKCEDDVRDEHNALYGMMRWLLGSNKRYRDKFDYYCEQAEEIKHHLNIYYSEEKGTSDFDSLSNRFGMFFGSIIKTYLEAYQNSIKAEKGFDLGFQLGKWLLLVDAVDDYWKDQEKGRFNALSLLSFDKDKVLWDDIETRVSFLHMLLKMKMMESIGRLSFVNNKDILENIVSVGCNAQLKQALDNQKRRYGRMIK